MVVMRIGQALASSKADQTETEIFLAHLLGKDRSYIKAFPEFSLNENHIAKYKNFAKRRAAHEPLAYILGYKEFCGIKIKVDKRVMVPRDETEEIITNIVSHVYATPNRNRKNHWEYDRLKIVDVGTGSGNIAISLARTIPFAKIFAIEKDAKAYELAKENISIHGLGKQIELIRGDLLDPIHEPIDIIVANLPYIPVSRFSSLPEEITHWEPRVALNGGEDGLEIYRKLFIQIPEKIKQNGHLFYEVDGQILTKQYISDKIVWL